MIRRSVRQRKPSVNRMEASRSNVAVAMTDSPVPRAKALPQAVPGMPADESVGVGRGGRDAMEWGRR
jgi:hypothetical protein